MKVFIGEDVKAFAPTFRTVTIRKISGEKITVSLGFDTKGDDILMVIDIADILPRHIDYRIF